MHPSSTRLPKVPSGATARWLFVALALPLASCGGGEPPEQPVVTENVQNTPLSSSTREPVADAPASPVPDSAPAEESMAESELDRTIASNPIMESYFERSPAYQRYRAYLELQRQEAAAGGQLAEGELTDEALTDEALTADERAGELTEEELEDATIASIILPPGNDNLATYAQRCDAATGLHVPEFNCNDGTEIPQGVIQTTLSTANIGMTGGVRSAGTPVVTSNTIQAAGADIWNNADSFFFAYTSNLSGGQPNGAPGGVDGYAEVLVTGLQNTHAFAKAGIMFRDGTAPGAVNVTLAITPTSGALLQKRLVTNGTSTNQILAGRAVPTWLRLVRRTNTFTGYVSTDRVTWTPVGDPVVFQNGFTSNPLVGLAVSSHVSGVQTTAVLDRFSWTNLGAGAVCDQPNGLHGTCDPGSRFQVLAQTREATVVANCRKQNPTATAGVNVYGDIGVIQYNKQNGAICFYQAYGVTSANAMPAPSTGTGPWLTPAATHAGGCTGCHDNGGFIRSPYLTQLDGDTFPSKPHLLPSVQDGYDNSSIDLRYVGRDFVPDRSWSIHTPKDPGDTDGNPADGDYLNCNACHRLAISNVVQEVSGTAALFGPMATEASFGSTTMGINFKTAHGPTSPIWMRRGQITHQPGAQATAGHFRDCANSFWTGQSPGFSAGFDDPNDSCTFSPLGVPFEPFADSQSFTDVNIGITGATRTANDMLHTLQAAGADIYGTSDQFLYSYKLLAGDGSATVKVNSLTNTHAFAKAGIMFRDGTGPSAVNAMVAMTPSGAHFQYRNAVGGNTTSFNLAGQSNPRWLKIARAGRTFVGYVSSDQRDWTQVGSPMTLPINNFPPSSLALVGLAATSHDASTPTQAAFDHFAWLPATSQTLLDANIGITNGSHSFRAGTHTIHAGGTDIFGAADQFFYAFKSKGGTGSITAKVTSIANTDPYAKAGVMFRNSAVDNSAHVMMEITAAQGAIFQYRPVIGGQAQAVIAPGYSAPRSVRLTREANGTFRGYVQENDATWTQIGSVSLPSFNDPALVGLAVTSHNGNAVTTGTFSDVSLP